ncbi:MAG: methyltransferase domain-containing protein [Desulfurococcales archaeon]|nr:methyltransferase domain-containing protein [Desulfurococcales archaeon]
MSGQQLTSSRGGDDTERLLQKAQEWILRLALVLGSRQIVPFVPVRYEVIPTILDSLELGPDDVFYDLGCGDGRVVVYAAKYYGVRRSVCVEINRDLAMEALERAAREGVADRVVVLNADFMEIDVSDATAVYMYLLSSINEALAPKLEVELSPGSRVATLDFPIPNWIPVKVIGKSGWQKTVYIYVIGRHKQAP